MEKQNVQHASVCCSGDPVLADVLHFLTSNLATLRMPLEATSLHRKLIRAKNYYPSAAQVSENYLEGKWWWWWQ